MGLLRDAIKRRGVRWPPCPPWEPPAPLAREPQLLEFKALAGTQGTVKAKVTSPEGTMLTEHLLQPGRGLLY